MYARDAREEEREGEKERDGSIGGFTCEEVCAVVHIYVCTCNLLQLIPPSSLPPPPSSLLPPPSTWFEAPTRCVALNRGEQAVKLTCTEGGDRSGRGIAFTYSDPVLGKHGIDMGESKQICQCALSHRSWKDNHDIEVFEEVRESVNPWGRRRGRRR